jgi:hypothetical protein
VALCLHKKPRTWDGRRGGEVCGRPAVCWWRQYYWNDWEPRCEAHAWGGERREMRGEKA